MLMAENLLLMRRRFRNSVSSAAVAFLAANGPHGMVIDFADASIAINDAADLLDFESIGQVSDGALIGPGAKLTYSAPSPKLTEQADGSLGFQAHNLCLQSETLTSATWVKNALTAPATDTLQASAGTSVQPYADQSITVIAGPTYTFTFEAMAGTSTFLQYSSSNAWGASYQNINLATNSFGTGNISGAVLSTPIDVGDGWYRYSISAPSVGTVFGARFSIQELATDTRLKVWSPTGTETVHIRKAHVRRTPSQSDYIATTTAAVYDLPYVYSGGEKIGIMVEPAATNFATRSTDFTDAAWSPANVTISGNAGGAPDGTTTADLIYPTTSGSNRWLVRTITTGSTADKTFSVFAKASGKNWLHLLGAGGSQGAYFNVSDGTIGTVSSGTASIVPLGNGWYRCSLVSASPTPSVTYTTPAICDNNGSLAVTANGTDGILLWGAQLETGTVATSPIITYGAAVLRAADAPEIPTSLFPYNISEGALYIEAEVPTLIANSRYLSLNNNTSTIRVLDLFQATGTTINIFKSADGANTSVTTSAVAGVQRIAARYKADDYHSAYNGTLGTPDTTTGAMQTATMLEIGHLANGSQMPMLVKRVAYFPDAKANAVLTEITTP